ncbi:MAG: PEP-CTERM sorting domain-containing protein [Candidatus Methylumidiphilus sp.]
MSQATPITFDLTSGVNALSNFSKTVSGVTLNFLNPSARTAFSGDADGLALGPQGGFITGAALTSFQITVVGATLQFTGYNITYTGGSGAFSLSGGSGSSNLNSLVSDGVFSANGSWMLAPGQTGTLTATGFSGNNNIAQLNQLTFNTVSTSVPEPSTLALFFIGAGALGMSRRKHRIQTLS